MTSVNVDRDIGMFGSEMGSLEKVMLLDRLRVRTNIILLLLYTDTKTRTRMDLTHFPHDQFCIECSVVSISFYFMLPFWYIKILIFTPECRRRYGVGVTRKLAVKQKSCAIAKMTAQCALHVP